MDDTARGSSKVLLVNILNDFERKLFSSAKDWTVSISFEVWNGDWREIG